MRAVAVYLALLAGAAAMFLLAPQLDLWTSGLFYVPGRGFPLAAAWPLAWVHHEIGLVAGAIIALLIFATLWLYLLGRPLWRFDRKAIIFLAAALVLGPGLFANTLLKDHWGRARPAQIAEFGGAHHFTPAPVPAGECPKNCSFVSGDAALGFALVGFAFLLPAGKPRRNGIAAALALGALIGLARIAQGGHFLSDVVFAGFLVYGTNAVLWWWIVVPDRPRSPGWTWTAAVAVVVVALIAAVDRPLALAVHHHAAALRPLFDPIGRLGLGYGWLCLFGLVFAMLYWGGALPSFAGNAARLRAHAALPGFLFAAVAGSGVAVDVLKPLFGRARPKLLFADGAYGFAWFSLDPRHWSFPSGHAATITALMAGLWWLWPRQLWFYVLAAGLVTAARVVDGAHYPSDAVAGAFIAIVVTRAVRSGCIAWGVDLRPFNAGGGGPPRAPAARLLRRRGV